jgi:hypothetical protein
LESPVYEGQESRWFHSVSHRTRPFAGWSHYSGTERSDKGSSPGSARRRILLPEHSSSRCHSNAPSGQRSAGGFGVHFVETGHFPYLHPFRPNLARAVMPLGLRQKRTCPVGARGCPERVSTLIRCDFRGERATDAVPFSFHESRWLHYARMQDFPSGLIPIEDCPLPV